MTTIRLGCGRAGTLFYEPNGLLLRTCLVPVDGGHSGHLLTFQLGYLGPGDITVHVALDGESGPPRPPAAGPSITPALLRGTDAAEEDDVLEAARHRIPGVWLSYLPVPDSRVACRYTVWGQPGGSEDDLRGEISTEISGRMPLLTATTRASVTRAPIPAGVRSQAAFEWNQEDGRGNFPLPRCQPLLTSVPAQTAGDGRR